jgi:hypothetical protein
LTLRHGAPSAATSTGYGLSFNARHPERVEVRVADVSIGEAPAVN